MIFVFGDYELDTERIELRQTGTPVAIEPQVFDVLVHLVTHRDRVVTKNELLDNVWGDRFVSESALTSRIKAARRLVGDDGRNQQVIRTSHGRGYRFVAPVAERDGSSPVPATAPAAAAVLDLPAPSNPVEASAPGATMVRPLAAPAPPLTTGRWPLVGRGAELELVARAYSDRRLGGVILTGAAGLGKTRLAEECLVAATRSGVATARVTGNPEARSVSLGALAHLVPTDIVALVGPDGELDRTTLFHRARAAVTSLAPEDERLMVHVDDVDQLDELSRALIGSLVVDGSVFAIVTIRSGQGPVPTVDHLEKDGRLVRVELGELAESAIETVLHRVLGGPMVAESLAELVAASLGNPGILRQLVDGARETGALAESNGIWHLSGALQPSSSLEVLVADRLQGVEGEARHAVELLAVAGSLGLDLLVSACGIDAVDALDRLGVVAVRTGGRRTDVALAHPLYGEVIRRQMSTLRARLLRRELAEAVEAVGARRRDDEVRVVAWRMEGGGQIETESLLRAARLALVDRNHEVAQRLLERACSDEPSVEATQLLAEVHFRLGNTTTVESLLSELDIDALDDLQRAAVARRRANNQFFGTTNYEACFSILTEAIDAVTDPEVRRSLEATLAQMLVNGGQISESLGRAEATLVGATGSVRLEALRALGLALLSAGRPVDALGAIREARRLHAEAAADVALPGLTMLLFSEAVALAEQGWIDEGRRAVETARSEHPGAQRSWLDTAMGRIELLAGRAGAVRRAVDPVIHESRARGLGAAERWVLALRACAWVLDGDVEAARTDVERATELEDGPRGLFHPDIDRAKAWLAMQQGDAEAAAAQLRWSADEARDRGAHGFEAVLLHDLARFGVAAEVADRLTALAGQLQGPLHQARVLHASGLSVGDRDRLAEAATLFEQCGAELFAAEATGAAASL
jgi:DNA-binding winged helix-turn-helix (wHTH) protein/tetratricopeptide (TPR) repeat protein